MEKLNVNAVKCAADRLPQGKSSGFEDLHIRCLSVVPVDLKALLREIEKETEGK